MLSTNLPKEQHLKELEARRKRVAKLEGRKPGHWRLVKAELAVKEAERYRAIFASECEALLVIDGHHQIIDANSRLTEITSLAKSDLVGKDIRSLATIMTKENLDIIRNSLLRRMSDATLPPYEVEITPKNGATATVTISLQSLENKNGADEYLVVLRDITTRKRMDQALRDSEEKYRSLINNLKLGVFRSTLAGRYLEVNPAMEEITGYSRAELLNMNVTDLYSDPEERLVILAQLTTNTGKKTYEIRNKRNDGTPIIISMTLTAVVNASGKALYFDGVLADITERNKIEEQINYQALLVNNVSDAIISTDMNSHVLSWNKAAENIFGWKQEDVIGKSIMEAIPSKMSPESFEDSLSQLNRTGNWLGEASHQRRDGVFLDFISTVSRIEGSSHNPIGYVCILHDITEQKKTAESIQEANVFNESILRNSPNPIMVNDPDSCVRYVNPAFEKLTGFTAGEILGTKPPFPYWPQERAAEYLQDVEKTLLPSKRTNLERFFRKKSGEPLWVELTPASVTDETGKLSYFVAIWTDVTERKKTEEIVHANERKFRTLFELESDAIFLVDSETSRILEANQTATALYGYAREELLQMRYFDLSAEPEQTRQAVGEKKNKILTRLHRRKDGTVFPVELTGNFFDWRDRPVHMAAIRDITERKQLENILIRSEEKYRSLVNNIKLGIFRSLPGENGKFWEVNEAMEEITGYSRVQLLTMEARKLYVNPDERVKFLTEVASFRGKITREFHFKKQDGSQINIAATVTPVKDANNNIHYFDGILEDITDRKQAEEAFIKERDKAQNYLDVVGVIIVAINSDGKITLINRKGCQLLGWKQEQIIGKNWFDNFVPTRFKGELSTVFKKLFSGGTGSSEFYENPVLTRSGEERLIAWHNTALMDNNGNIIGTLSSGEDITERRQAEELFRSLATSLPVGVYIEKKGNFIYSNPYFQKKSGYSENELSGKESMMMILPEDRKTVKDNAIQMLKGQCIDPYEFRVIDKNGQIKWILESVTPIEYLGERTTLGCFQDITERKQMQVQLALTDRLASIGELAAGIAHELNNPLTSVVGFSQLLMERDVPAEMKEDLSLVNSEAQRCASIVKNLLTFARKHAPEKQLGQINNIIEDVLRLRAYDQKVNNIVIERRFDPDLPEITVDYFQMQQVFLNLVINAEYFMLQAHNRGTLIIITERHKNTVRISFADDGPGITQENLSHLFNPFFTTKEVGKGTGLGLSICHGIIAEHGGKIHAESQWGKGATFIVELPVNGH